MPARSPAAAIMDVIGYYSWSEHGDSVCTNYYQKMMKNQKLVREDSEVMLDLIFSTVGCDLAGIFRIGELSGNRSLNSTLTDIVNGVHENFTSAYEKFEPVCMSVNYLQPVFMQIYHSHSHIRDSLPGISAGCFMVA